MSDSLLFRTKSSTIQSKFINQLEREFTSIVQLLYTSNVSASLIERQVLPYFSKNILFKDPFVESNGKEFYRLNLEGFHNLFRSTYDTFQLNIKLNDDGRTGRCIVDGTLNFTQFSWIYTYPARTILVFEFRLLNNPTIDEPQFEIFRHEEMWSISDMIDAVPGLGWFYKNIFRRGFGYLFVGISSLSCFLHDSLVQSTKKKQ